jgi:spore coat-associated protein N
VNWRKAAQAINQESDAMSRTMSTRAKLLASTALLAAAAGAAGLGTFGSFTSTTSASQAVTTGTLNVALGTAASTGNRLSIAATGLVPGDSLQRTATLTNSGNQALSTLSLTTTASTSTVLDTDTTKGLQMTVQSCAAGWVEAGVSPKYTYTCAAGATTVIASRPVIGSALALSGLAALSPAGVDNLMITLALPSTADNTFQNKTSTVLFTFDGMQRAATNQ